MRLGVRDAVVDGVVVSGDVTVADGRIAAVGVAPRGRGGVALAGFVDLQVNGFAGVDFLSGDEEGYARACEALAATGVTAFQPTLVSAPVDDLRRALRVAAHALSRPPAGARPIGVHLEGPFLAPRWAGVHDPSYLRPVDLDLARELCSAGRVTTMTLAPELDGGLDLVGALVRRGVVVSLGHTDADARTARAAFDRGARAITHIYNAHRRWAARDPGVAGAALVDGAVTVTAIADGRHLAPEAAFAAYLAARGRFALVTDATAAAAMPDGEYRLGGIEVIRSNNEARTRAGGLAGGAAGMDELFRNLVALSAPLPDAADAAAGAPARLLGRDDVGTLRPGAAADVAVVDDALVVTRTIVSGAEVMAR